MNKHTLGFCCLFASSLTALTSPAADTGSAFYGDPPDDHHPWAVHDRNRPQPPVVTPGELGKPPSDAIVLFDGTNLSQWETTKRGGGPAQWLVQDGTMVVTPTGGIRTKQHFGDCQLHIEWAAPSEVKGNSQGRGNSGVFLMDRVEIQVLDNYNNPTYADGFAGSVYGVNPPLVNAIRPPGEFQVYDIVFRRPVYQGNQMLDPGYVTVFVNGALAQDHTMLEGGTGHMGRSKPAPFPAKGPLSLQDHGNPTRFRNIWIRELPPRITEGGTDGYLTVDATMAKRKETAAAIRADAALLKDPNDPLPEMLRAMESLAYEEDVATRQRVIQLAQTYAASLQNLAQDQQRSRKNEILRVNSAFQYMAKFKFLPMDFPPKLLLEQIVKDQRWDRR